MNTRSHDWLLGRRFVCDFRVTAVDPEKNTATLHMYGDHYHLGLDELHLIIERGLVVEANEA